MPGLFLFLALLAGGVSSEPKSARGNLQALFFGDDYPLISLRNDEQGTVTVRLDIDQTGLVSACKVIKTSGHVALDEQTCSVLRARARFEPATDSRGRARASHYTQRITWRLEGQSSPPLPRHAWYIRSTVVFAKDGTLIGCRTESTGVAGQQPFCDQLLAAAKATGGQNAASVPAGELISEAYFYPADPARAPEPPKIADATEVARQVSRVVIDASGAITRCEGVRYSGQASEQLDACALIRLERLVPAEGAADLVGTIVHIGATRVHRLS